MTIKEYIDNRNKINSLEEANIKFIRQFDDTIEFIVGTYTRLSPRYKWFYVYDPIFINNSGDSFTIPLKRYYNDDPDPDEHHLRIPVKYLTAPNNEIEGFLKEYVEQEEKEYKQYIIKQENELKEQQKNLEELYNTEDYKKYMELKKKFGE